MSSVEDGQKPFVTVHLRMFNPTVSPLIVVFGRLTFPKTPFPETKDHVPFIEGLAFKVALVPVTELQII